MTAGPGHRRRVLGKLVPWRIAVGLKEEMLGCFEFVVRDAEIPFLYTD